MCCFGVCAGEPGGACGDSGGGVVAAPSHLFQAGGVFANFYCVVGSGITYYRPLIVHFALAFSIGILALPLTFVPTLMKNKSRLTAFVWRCRIRFCDFRCWKCLATPSYLTGWSLPGRTYSVGHGLSLFWVVPSVGDYHTITVATSQLRKSE